MATDPRPDTSPSAHVRANDGIANVVTGIGTNRDPRAYNVYCLSRLSDQQIDAAYRASWVMRKIIDKPATEMVREWRDWQADAEQIKLLEALERKLDLRNKIRRAEVLRGLGGCGMVLWVGREDPALPINPRTLTTGSLRGIHVWHKSRFQLDDMETDPGSDWYGYPKFYRLQTRDGRQIRLHPSRVIALRGHEVPDISTAGWQDATCWRRSRAIRS
jgi:phage-related protein (TIGR01555 family)